ncbi:hypothetical protein HPB51_005932 [Rhipicephalus microplus]|uniref:Uncharacterized protein n=1 Tax=Rhipicephalus microplus TaxID=6941 RepID=A0A9J6E781_RHIMP|nr:hypothetical protein HPB51_005932 [Rhipicephalus microplus]
MNARALLSSKQTSRDIRLRVTDPATPWVLPATTPPAEPSSITIGREHEACECTSSAVSVSGVLGILQWVHLHAPRPYLYRKVHVAEDLLSWRCEAGLSIQGMLLTKPNYSIAVEVLIDRFGRKDHIIYDHIDSRFAIEPIETSSQVTRLRDLYEQKQFRTSCRESLDMPFSTVVWHSALMRSVPEDLELQYRKQTKTDTEAVDSAVQ